ncbi:MAG TPA: DNA repair exonuclease, partial [Edaphobacter sp.]|nr:DNA repair exonuclease [Edaphobacter sp.]
MRHSFRFLHAADLHLDSPLRGLSRYEGLSVDEIRSATRRALEALVSFATTEYVDFVVIAGDIFDGKWQDMGTGLFFAAAMARLSAADIPVFLLRGNHDAESAITQRLPLPPSVQFFSSKKVDTFLLEDHAVALHGKSFANIHVSEDMTTQYPAPVDGYFNIGVLHTSLGGYALHETYAPTSLAALTAKQYHYWALGHIHDYAILSEHPHIVYPGVLQGRKITETGVKGAVLVEVEDGAVRSAKLIPLDVIRWARVEVDCAALESRDELHQRMRAALRRSIESEADARPLVIRVILTGATSLHSELQDTLAPLREELRAIATEVDASLWIEKLSLATSETVVIASHVPEIGESDSQDLFA